MGEMDNEKQTEKNEPTHTSRIFRTFLVRRVRQEELLMEEERRSGWLVGAKVV